MYKLLLCLRYLRSRYIALASIISVTLGVATMIVVNSVMGGFATQMQSRIHGILSDLVFESHGLEGFPDAQRHMREIRDVAGDDIAAMSPTVVVPAMLVFNVQGQSHMRQITFVGIDETTHGAVGEFNRYLQHPKNREQLKFELREDGYDTVDYQGGPDARVRHRMDIGGWKHRRLWSQFAKDLREPGSPQDLAGPPEAGAPENQAFAEPPEEIEHDGFVYQRDQPEAQGEGTLFDPTQQTHAPLVMGMALACYRLHDGSDQFFLLPGDDVQVVVPTVGSPPRERMDSFTIVDFYESKLSEYDATMVFVPLKQLQKMRDMIDPQTGEASITSIQIKLRPGADLNQVRDKLRQKFPAETYGIHTWRDKQGPLLAAVDLEVVILNLLLFLIIAVAGFGILAIFYMIVVEKTRDIGILKSLGASNRGVMGIFLAYGLALGIVGAGGGLTLGLLFVAYINQIADFVGKLTGQPVFDPAVYYFHEIPTVVEPLTVAWIVLGAMAIAVVASILPARRAARLHPVEALRHR